MKKLFIQNRKGQKIVILLEESDHTKGLAFVMHGLGGTKDQPQMAAFAQAFKENGFTVVRFDTTNTFGESEGNYEDATVTNYYEDLEDAISWAKQQSWYQEQFYLAGHSLGGICTTLYTEKYPNEVKGLAPISTVVSGKLSKEARPKEDFEEWERTGWKEEPSSSTPGLVKRLKWSHMVDRLLYDVLPESSKLTMPVLLIVGEDDPITPPKHQQLLFDALPNKKEFHIIKNAQHTIKGEEQLAEIKQLFSKWIEKTENV